MVKVIFSIPFQSSSAVKVTAKPDVAIITFVFPVQDNRKFSLSISPIYWEKSLNKEPSSLKANEAGKSMAGASLSASTVTNTSSKAVPELSSSTVKIIFSEPNQFASRVENVTSYPLTSI